MKYILPTLMLAGLCGLVVPTPTALAQGTALTYQGRLNDAAGPANGTYNFQFTVRDAITGGSPVGVNPLPATLVVSNGLFTTTLDPGAGVFTGADRWLEIAVRTNGAVSFITLSPRQKITAAPYAIFSGGASTVAANGVNAAAIQNGAIGLAKVASGVIDATNLAPNSVTSAQLADSIALGASNVVGQLDVFRTAAGTPAISLFGGASQISTYGSDGLEQIRLWGVSYGEMWLLNNLPSNDRAVFLSANGANGGYLALGSSNGINRAALSGANAGGVLDLLNGFNSLTLHLRSEERRVGKECA